MNLNRLAALILGGVLGCAGSGLAAAQTILLTPSFSLSGEYDDNVNLSPTAPQTDLVTVVIPGLRLEGRDHPWYVTLAGSLRGEFFSTRSELNNFGDNGSGNAAVEFRPTPSLTASLTNTLVRSLNPADVDPTTGLTTTGRSVSTNNTLSPTMRYQITPDTLLGLQYSLSMFRSDAPLSRDSDTHTVDSLVEHRLLPQYSMSLRHTFNQFRVEGNPAQNSHQPRLGLAHNFSPTIRLSSENGLLLLDRPDGSTEQTWSSTHRYDQQFRGWALSLSYDRSSRLAGAIGEAGVSQSLTTATSYSITRALTLALNSVLRKTESLGPAGDLRVDSHGIQVNYQPLRSLSMGLQATVSDGRSSNRAVDFRTYSGAVQVSYRLLRWLSIRGGYRLERQEDRAVPSDLGRNVFSLDLTASDQFRVY